MCLLEPSCLSTRIVVFCPSEIICHALILERERGYLHPSGPNSLAERFPSLHWLSPAWFLPSVLLSLSQA
ncbi:hypothetical protein Y1Q_0007959 [Alligator mississippiensis]|uniref:Uncharacterized protein n=1 Tax=Alligator mississippiensis TaxID=8496 RepID=A0A151NF02_ALLMI|nr:hypothetical protein Y1Q_0007959 [Alligator mississippiensis]